MFSSASPSSLLGFIFSIYACKNPKKYALYLLNLAESVRWLVVKNFNEKKHRIVTRKHDIRSDITLKVKRYNQHANLTPCFLLFTQSQQATTIAQASLETISTGK